MRGRWFLRSRSDEPRRYPSAQQVKRLLEGVTDGLIALGGGAYGVVLDVQARNLALISPEEQDQIVAAFAAFLNSLTFPLQILVRIERLGAEDYLNQLTERAGAETATSLLPLALAQLGFVRELAVSRLLLQRHFFLVIPFTSPHAQVRGGWLGWLRPVPMALPTPFGLVQRQLALRETQVIRGLESVGLTVHALSTDEILALYFSALCPTLARIQPLRQAIAAARDPMIQRTPPFNRPSLQGKRPATLRVPCSAIPQEGDAELFRRGMRSVADLIAPASWEVHRSYLRLDDVYLRSLIVVGLPRYVSAAWLAPLVCFPEPLDLSIHLVPLEPTAAMRALTQRMVQLQSSRLLDAGEGRLADPAREIAYADCARLRDALQRGDERIFSAGISVTVRSGSLVGLDRLTELVETTVAGMLAQSRRCTFEHEAGFRSSLPEARDHLGVRHNLDTSSVASAFPFTSATLVHPRGVLYGINLHDRSLVIVDSFHPDLPNANCCVFAKSGMGKSFAVKLELVRSLVLGVDYVVIDPENEYARLCAAVDGQIIRLAPSSPHKINPFDLTSADPDDGDPLEQKIESLLTFLDLLLAEREHPLSMDQRATLSAALRLVYQEAGILPDPRTHARTPPTLADLHRILQRTSRETSLAQRLERFLGGQVGPVFAGQTNVDLGRRLVVFAVRDLPEELRPVATFLIADFVWSAVRRACKPRRLVIDEAWTLAQSPVGGRFLASLARRARKYYLGLTTITQDVGDFLASKQGRAVLQNSALKLLLRQDAAAIDQVAETLKLAVGERDLLVRCGKGQALLATPETRVGVEILASAEEYRLITSDPRDALASGPQRTISGELGCLEERGSDTRRRQW